MASPFKRTILRPIPYLLTDRGGQLIARLWTKKLRREIGGAVTDKFLEFLLGGMDLAFCLSRDYRKNINGFQGRYLFRTADYAVAASATFSGGDMQWHEEGIKDWDVRVTFKNAPAMMAFIFSKDQDILDSLLKNEVEVDGNLNYIYKFGFMARDLTYRLGMAA